MKLNQALKTKSRMVGELNRLQQIFQRENARRNDSTSKVDRTALWDQIIKLSTEIGELKAKIVVANIKVYPKLERMSELKGRIKFITQLTKRDGEEVHRGYTAAPATTYTWDSCISQEKEDVMVKELQEQINTLQDEIDIINATTDI